MKICRRIGGAVEVVHLTPEGTRIRRGDRFRKRLMKSGTDWAGFWLFTFPESSMLGLSMREKHQFCMNAWRLLRARMWEAGKPFRFVLTVEWTKKMVPHLHVLIDRLVSKRTMVKHWVAVGGGSFMRAARVRGGHIGKKQAINYICKYLTKFEIHVSGARRWAYSKNLLDKVVKTVSDWCRVTSSDILTLNLEYELHVDNGDGVWAYFPLGWVERME